MSHVTLTLPFLCFSSHREKLTDGGSLINGATLSSSKGNSTMTFHESRNKQTIAKKNNYIFFSVLWPTNEVHILQCLICKPLILRCCVSFQIATIPISSCLLLLRAMIESVGFMPWLKVLGLCHC